MASTSERAGFWRRLAAALIDGLIVGLVSGIFEALSPRSGYLFGILVAATYFTYFEGGPAGAGFGKRAMRIRVVDLDSGGPIGYGRAFIRYVGRIVSAFVLYLGYLWMLWDRERQCWHDKFANDVVVPTYE
ncbi:MAG TPA: RDD family protein [Solirubrobacteraceae bacterium]|nr:RDD family protein [Solirubrobacteraceae bacterium]